MPSCAVFANRTHLTRTVFRIASIICQINGFFSLLSQLKAIMGNEVVCYQRIFTSTVYLLRVPNSFMFVCVFLLRIYPKTHYFTHGTLLRLRVSAKRLKCNCEIHQIHKLFLITFFAPSHSLNAFCLVLSGRFLVFLHACDTCSLSEKRACEQHAWLVYTGAHRRPWRLFASPHFCSGLSLCV